MAAPWSELRDLVMGEVMRDRQQTLAAQVGQVECTASPEAHDAERLPCGGCGAAK